MPINFFSFEVSSYLNLFLIALVIWPIIYQLILWRFFLKKFSFFKKNELITHSLRKSKIKNLIHYAIVGVVGLAATSILYLIGSLFLESEEFWIKNKMSVIAAIIFTAATSIIGLVTMGILISQMKINHKIDWNSIKNISIEKDLNFNNSDFQIRWLDPITKQYEEANQKVLNVEWKKDFNFYHSMSIKKNISFNVLNHYLAKADCFYFYGINAPEKNIEFICSAVVNQLIQEGLYENLDSAIDDLSKKIY
ncbi:hypothetical protein KQ874_03145 [Mycoplasma sp. ES3157-GEN-MYC]|uniref:Uncharacterized protein n=2 Tax=Mycoplasma TaxID=2093 RepID=A0A6M4JA20_9MOLU|nr:MULTISPECIES: hypothetical protein [Mycoplasma]MBU4689698.1 hypothetical protein [Mycoplasma zalophidermidis]MBU4690672.1 hypothetical protein [Mycoplasma miroungigenitalium]MBU4691941.1 hypothetical protein [Mycoplasma miroungigenitalium]MBU4693906.1 hypothetical protein [Mycoplasma zalophidermidis]QJR43793.1 hypothetical protein HLA87_03340 [Mycoplasma miroungigenitalium]